MYPFVLVLYPIRNQRIERYSLASLILASLVVNCQLILAAFALRRIVHARTCFLKLSLSGNSFAKACRLITSISISAILSQLPCFGVKCHSNRSVNLQASSGGNDLYLANEEIFRIHPPCPPSFWRAGQGAAAIIAVSIPPPQRRMGVQRDSSRWRCPRRTSHRVGK